MLSLWETWLVYGHAEQDASVAIDVDATPECGIPTSPETPKRSSKAARSIRTITPGLPKRAKLKGGQITLTQFTEEEESSAAPTSPASAAGSVLSQAPSEASEASSQALVSSDRPSSSPSASSNGPPPIVENDALVTLLKELQEGLSVLMKQIETAYNWIGEVGFPQKRWVDIELVQAIQAVEECPALVSVMGRVDMKRFLPTIKSENTFVLLKQLSVNLGFKILLDTDLRSLQAVFKLQHHRGSSENYGDNLFEYGTDEEINWDIFEQV